jgi:exosortase N
VLKKLRFTDALLIAYAVLTAVAFRAFFKLDATLLVGIAVLPTLFLASEKRVSWSVFWLLPLVVSAFLTTSYTLLYFAIISAVVWFYSRRVGQLSALPVLLLLTISPVFNYFTDVFSVDLKLKITDVAVKILNKISFQGIEKDPSVSDAFLSLSAENSSNSIVSNKIQAFGNLIRLPNGDEWQIDTACMGLNMLGVGLILTYFFIGFFSKKIGKLPTNRGLFAFVFAALCLNLVSNLTRIVAVVLLNIPTETVGHDVVGLLCFSIYSILPMYFLIKIGMRSPFFFKKKINQQAFLNAVGISKNSDFIIPVILFILLASRAVFLDFHKKMPENIVLSTEITANFTIKNLNNGVTQLRNDSTLIYLKNLPHSFTTEHSPMICWKGSGYEFRQIEQTKIGETPIYIGILQRDTDQIHATWWFESDRFATNDQISWRYRFFTEGSSFRLVNVNAATRERVLAASKQWLAARK